MSNVGIYSRTQHPSLENWKLLSQILATPDSSNLVGELSGIVTLLLTGTFPLRFSAQSSLSPFLNQVFQKRPL
jgi:hypothetical protein